MGNYSLTALISIPEEAGYFFPNRHFVSIAGSSLYNVMLNKLESNYRIDKVIINTDSSQIKNYYSRSPNVKVVNAYQAELQEIEIELTSDKMTTELLKHAEGEHFIQMGAIFPFVKPDTINSVIDAYERYVLDDEDHRNDSVFTIKSMYRRLYDSDADIIREDRPNTFVEDGILHVFNRTTFLANGNRKVGKKPFSYGIDDIENCAIDSEDNYRIATLIDENRYRFPRLFGR